MRELVLMSARLKRELSSRRWHICRIGICGCRKLGSFNLFGIQAGLAEIGGVMLNTHNGWVDARCSELC